MRPYKKAREEARSGGGSLFKLITLPGYAGSVWTPKWCKKGEARLETHFRPTGPLTADGTAMMPWRAGSEPGNYGEWITGMPILTMGTANKETFIAAFEDPDSPGDILDPDIHTTPAYEFITNVKRLCRDNSRLENLLMKGGNNRAAAVPGYVATRGLVQGIMLKHGANSYYDKPAAAMMMLSPSACAALEEALDAEVDGYNGDPDDYAARFQCGDVLDVNAGRILSFFNADSIVPGAAATSVNWDQANSQSKLGTRKSKSDFSRYACEIVAADEAGTPMALPLPRDITTGKVGLPNMKLFTPWHEVLRFLTEDEMIDVIVRSFADMPEIVLACLKTYHEKLPPYVKNSATSIAMGNLTGNTDQLPGIGAAPLAPTPAPQGAGTVPAGVPLPQASAPAAPAAPQAAQVNWAAAPAPEAPTAPAAAPAEPKEEFIPQGAITPEDMAKLAGETAGAQAPAAGPAAQPAASNADAVASALERINNLKAEVTG